MNKLWVKSQDGEAVGYFDVVMVSGFEIVGYVCDEGFILGKYTSKEECLHVLDLVSKHREYCLDPFQMPEVTKYAECVH